MNRHEVEQEILAVLDHEQTAIGICEKLFTPDGLFSLLASNEMERRSLVQDPLYRQAQIRFRELQFKEADVFRQAIANLESTELPKN